MKKTSISFAFLLSLITLAAAQNLHLERTESQHKPLYTHTQIDVNYINYPIKNLNTNGIGLNVAVVFRDRLATGLSLDITDSRVFSGVKALPPEATAFEYTQVSWMNEIILHPNSKIDFSLVSQGSSLKTNNTSTSTNAASGDARKNTLSASKDKNATDFKPMTTRALDRSKKDRTSPKKLGKSAPKSDAKPSTKSRSKNSKNKGKR